MFDLIWYTFLYQPLFNALIWVYVNIAGENLGWAIVWLTIFLRILLLPLTVISELTARRREKGAEEAARAMEAFKNDRIAQREVAREVMKKYHISPWAKVLMLGIQLLVLVLLYQVFLQGVSGDKVIKTLYPSIDYPGKINTNFYGFEVGNTHETIWAGMAALYLFISSLIGMRNQKADRSDMYFILLFPLFTFVILWYLPMVKSIFILTTMLFSDSIKLIKKIAFSKSKEKVPQPKTA